MNKCKFWKYIMSFVKEKKANFDKNFSDISSQQLRALFTSYCLMFDVKANTGESDLYLQNIFNKTDIWFGLRENFDNFMLEFIEEKLQKEITFARGEYGVYTIKINGKVSGYTIDEISSGKWQVCNYITKNRYKNQVYTARTLKNCKEWAEKNLV